MPNIIDRLLNRITMYRLVMYFLIVLLGVAAVFGAFGILPYSPLAILFSTLTLVIVCWAANTIFAKIFRAQANIESVYITALILALIITPVVPSDSSGVFFLIWASVFAMASKYVLAISKKHVFNPAALAVALTALALGQYASWWVGGNLPLLAFVLIGGLLVVRKIQRFDLALSFIFAALVSIILTSPGENPLTVIQKALIHTPIFFFAAIMITEPATTPPTRGLRMMYGAFTGLIFAPAFHIGPYYSTPELALIVGNIFSYGMSPKGKHVLALKEKSEVGNGLYDFVFETKKSIDFAPGQYMEWTLAHAKSDSRGDRRYFTLASSPTEPNLRLGVRFYENSSSFKRRLLAMKEGDEIMGGQLEGDFVLPRDKTKKLVFVAGGIGITPFRSMVKYLSDRGERRDIVLLYSNRTAAEIAYREVFDEAAKKIELKTIYALTAPGETIPANGHAGRIDRTIIKKEIPDYAERSFYISGTQAMVDGFEKMLHEMNVPRTQIKTDFFPGFS